MTKKLVTACVLAAASLSHGAVSISLTGNPVTGPDFIYYVVEPSHPIGIPLPVPDGSLIRIGTFLSPPAANSTFAELGSSFREFSRTDMGNPVNTSTGHVVRNDITGSNTADSPDADSFFVGRSIYIWVYDTPVAASSGPQGIYGTSLTFQDQPTAVSVSTTGFVNAWGDWLGSGPARVNINPANGQATRLYLAGYRIIPEPSSVMLGGILAAVGLTRRRR